MVNVSDRIEPCVLHFAENQKNNLKRKKWGRKKKRRNGMNERGRRRDKDKKKKSKEKNKE